MRIVEHLERTFGRRCTPSNGVFLGHADIGTTRNVYAPADVDQAREAVKRYRTGEQ